MVQGSHQQVDLSALSALAPELAATFVSIASDIALVIDPEGVIRNVAVGESGLAESTDGWVGRAWADTVTTDTRGKIEQLLRDVGEGRASRRREVNHPSGLGASIPVAWAAIRLGRDGPVLAVGRDLRAVAAIQQRYIDAQQEIERDYWKRRQAEARYRLLFQVATDAVLVVDGATLRILEANRAAMQLFGRTLAQMVGRTVGDGIDAHSRPLVEELLSMARSTGRASEVRARVQMPEAAAPAFGTRPPLIDLSATPFRAPDGGQGATQLLLVRARAVAPGEAEAAQARVLAEFVERAGDGIVITDPSGRILMANPAFAALCAPGRAEAIKGQALTDLIAGSQPVLAEVLAEVRRHGMAAREAVALPGPDGARLEVSASMLAEGDQECIGFTLRRHLPRLAPPAAPASSLAQSLAQLGAELDEQLGTRPLPQLLAAVNTLAEKRLIALAVQRSEGDFGRAAQLLGVSVEQLSARQAPPDAGPTAP